MKRNKRIQKHPLLLAPLAGLLVACVGCPSTATTAGAGYPAPAAPGNPSAGSSTYYPGTLTGAQPRRTPSASSIPALISSQPSGTPAPRVRSRPQAPTSNAPFGLRDLEPVSSSRPTERTQLLPRDLPRRTPARPAAPRPSTSRPTGPFGLDSNADAGAGAGARAPARPPANAAPVARSAEDQARDFYIRYVQTIHERYRSNGRRGSIQDPSIYNKGEAAPVRAALRTQIATGRRSDPAGYQAFSAHFEEYWKSYQQEDSGLDWLASSSSTSRHSRVDEAHMMAWLFEALDQAYPETQTSPGVEPVVQPEAQERLASLAGADFYRHYLSSAHHAYKRAWSFSNMDETNDFAEALAAGIKADEAGYEAARKKVEAVSGDDLLGWFRYSWNNYLRLTTGHGNDDEIVRSGRGGKVRKVNGKTRSQWKSEAETNMGKVSAALFEAF